MGFKYKKSEMVKTSPKKINYEIITHVLITSLVILFIINLVFTVTLQSAIKEQIKDQEEADRPALIQLTTITADCSNCFSIDPIKKQIKSLNVNITQEQTLNTQQASDLINKYQIKKLPTVVVTGEIKKVNADFLTEKNDALIFQDQSLPYYDLDEKREIGSVKATLIKVLNCKDCFDVSLLINQLKQSGVVIKNVVTYSENDKEAKDLIKKFNLDKLPALILSPDLKYYEDITKAWEDLGSVDENNYVLRSVIPPYKELLTSQIKGLVKLTYLTDKSCTECYNVSRNKLILQNMGIVINEEETIDISDSKGKELINKYLIKKVPAFILSKDIKIYNSFQTVLKKVGIENSDETYLFNSTEVLGTYKDLSTNKIITPKSQTQDQSQPQ